VAQHNTNATVNVPVAWKGRTLGTLSLDGAAIAAIFPDFERYFVSCSEPAAPDPQAMTANIKAAPLSEPIGKLALEQIWHVHDLARPIPPPPPPTPNEQYIQALQRRIFGENLTRTSAQAWMVVNVLGLKVHEIIPDAPQLQVSQRGRNRSPALPRNDRADPGDRHAHHEYRRGQVEQSAADGARKCLD